MANKTKSKKKTAKRKKNMQSRATVWIRDPTTPPIPPDRLRIPHNAWGGYDQSGGKTFVGLCYQINTGVMRSISNHPKGTWSQTLSATDCPTVGATYLLNVYYSYTIGTQLHADLVSTSFVRSS
jgi:hypothetical protein